MNRPTPTEECALDPNIHTYGQYTRCLNSKILNPYEIGFEIAPKSNMGMILGVVAVIVILILIFLSVKAKVNPFDLIMSFFR